MNDFRELNANTVPDNHPLLLVDNILRDCAKEKNFAVIDLTNMFFQMLMHPEHIYLTVVSTLFELYEWLVMSMELKNAPTIYQQHVTATLRDYIS